ncbi:hypothetical protein EVAR_55808_1 [Eumeta japonica]|uniref:Uncharacterized protein n=1 Tax=Eumeta variegata TaxID=151549 RepID=A0A4C1ZE50_EUMVA|nr:hypothetical protein EVAR_55808_1 [Eumeta japonica]
MSFSGKKWKRSKAENAAEFMAALNAGDKLQGFLKQGDTVSSYTKVDDQTYTHKVEADGKVLQEKNFILGKENETTMPDGTILKNTYTLEGDVLKEHVIGSDGRNVYIERSFSGDTMKMKVTADGVDVAVHVEYTAV